jgi:hypothetical protein
MSEQQIQSKRIKQLEKELLRIDSEAKAKVLENITPLQQKIKQMEISV